MLILSLLREYYRWVLVGLGLVMAISIVVFLINYRHARHDALFIWRSAARARCRRLFGAMALQCLAIGAVVWLVLAGPSPTVARVALASPSTTPTQTRPIPAPSKTPAAAVVEPTATATTPRPAASPTPTEVPAATSVPTAGNPRFHDIVLARAVSAHKAPVDAGNQFAVGSEVVYAFFSFSDVPAGAPWGYAWLNGSIEMVHEATTWTWGRTGRAYIFFGPAGGYEAGDYGVRLYIGDQFQAEATFTIR